MIDNTIFNNKKVVYHTLGCKLNFAETSAIGKQLADEGFAMAFLKGSSHNQEIRKELTGISLKAAENKAATRTAPKTVPASKASTIKLID